MFRTEVLDLMMYLSTMFVSISKCKWVYWLSSVCKTRNPIAEKQTCLEIPMEPMTGFLKAAFLNSSVNVCLSSIVADCCAVVQIISIYLSEFSSKKPQTTNMLTLLPYPTHKDCVLVNLRKAVNNVVGTHDWNHQEWVSCTHHVKFSKKHVSTRIYLSAQWERLTKLNRR